MTLEDALDKDILAVLPPGGRFLSVGELAKRIAPLRERDVRDRLNTLFKKGYLNSIHGGGGWPSVYGRRPFGVSRIGRPRDYPR
jgi:hypothetical protein